MNIRPEVTIYAGRDGARLVHAQCSFTRADAGRLGPVVPGQSRITMREIAEEVAKRHQVTLNELRGPHRHKYISHARQEAMWLMYQTGQFSNAQIGHFLNRDDHTTVIHGRKAHEARMKAKGDA